MASLQLIELVEWKGVTEVARMYLLTVGAWVFLFFVFCKEHIYIPSYWDLNFLQPLPTGVSLHRTKAFLEKASL